MQILPVLDIKGGLVVRGVAGRRDEYKAIVSNWTSSAEPVAVANALHNVYGFRHFYLADLDAIAGSPAHLDIYAQLQAAGFLLLVDAGARTELMAQQILEAGVDCILGLETLEGPGVLQALATGPQAQRVCFSLDLKNGQPLGNDAAWATADPYSILEQAVRAGIQRVIVLDLAHVGMGQGVGTEELCRRIRCSHPELELTTGGGVAGLEDLQRLAACGVDRVLVASALHDGRLVPEQIKPYCPADDV
jgi:phosphoribosylformimino-5-aminoimidazole carboxamide ribotide isomerase